MAKHDLHRALRAHHRNFGARPCHHSISPKVLGAHRNVASTIRLSQHHRDFRNGRRRVGKQHFCPVPNDATVLLVNARQEPGRIHKRQQRNVERIAEANEPRNFVGRVDIKHAGQHARLVCDNAHRPALKPPKSSHYVRCEARLNFKQVVMIEQPFDHFTNVVGNFRICRNDAV